MADRRDGRGQTERWKGEQRVDRDRQQRGRDNDRDRDRQQQQPPQRWARGGHRNTQQWSAVGSKRTAGGRGGGPDSRERQPDPAKQLKTEQPQQQQQQVRFEDQRWRPQEEAEEGELGGQHDHSTDTPAIQQQQRRRQQQQRQQPPHQQQQQQHDIDAPSPSTLDPALPAESDEEEADVERERREREERKRRRTDILSKHQSIAVNASGPPPLPADLQPVPIAPQLRSPPSLGPAAAEQSVVPSLSVPVAAAAASTSEYDMFADSPSLLLPRAGSVTMRSAAGGSEVAPSGSAVSELLDSWDDAEGYYKYRLGDVLTDSSSRRQYRVCGLQGGGVFSTVLRVKQEGPAAEEESEGGELVVKVIRNNETMYKAGVKEVDFLTRIASTSTSTSTQPTATSSSPLTSPPRRHIVHLLHHFHHRSHLCLVFPPYAMDLRKVIKKFGSVGLSLPAVRVYAMQLFTALRHLVRAGIVHGDIKPDNILVNERLNECALCDFGSASYLADCSITPYLVSRFYRAPEIMLGCEYGVGIDTWSVGCVLYELYTGRILFDGRDNNDMLHKIKQLRGDYPARLTRRAAFASRHFDADGLFCVERNDVNGSKYRQAVSAGAQRELYADMRQFRGSEAKDEKGTRKLRRLTDLILLCLTLDPMKRPSVDELIKHPFIAEE